MVEIDSNLCRICLKSDSELKLINTFTNNNMFFSRFLEEKALPLDIWLCIWCDAAAKRANTLMKLAEKSKTILEKCKIENYDMNLNDSSCTGVFSLGCVHNEPIDIPPIQNEDDEPPHEESIVVFNQESSICDEFSKDDFLEIKSEYDNTIDDEETAVSCLDNDSLEENNQEEKVDEEKPKEKCFNKKEKDYKDMKFEVTYLTNEEQLNEIEMKKKTDKYKSMKYKCENCGVGYMFEDVYREHMKRHTKTTAHKCPICFLYFNSKLVLSQHLLAHRRRFACVVCRAVISRWTACILHRYKCDGICESVACPLCGKVFTNAISLDIHIRGVHKEREYECNECNRRFMTKHRLTAHIRCHSSLRAYTCTICSRKFTTRYNLRAHAKVHTNARQYYCVDCHKHYKTQKGLDRHYRESKRHLDEEELRFSCPDCPKRFPKENVLKSHINTRHLTIYKCEMCDKKFSNNSNLRKHTRCVHDKDKL